MFVKNAISFISNSAHNSKQHRHNNKRHGRGNNNNNAFSYTGIRPMDTQLYDTLGVSPSATPADIKRAFRKLAVKYHPDKRPAFSIYNTEQRKTIFQAVNAAYEVLRDEEQCKRYDKYGLDSLKQNQHSKTQSPSRKKGNDNVSRLFSNSFISVGKGNNDSSKKAFDAFFGITSGSDGGISDSCSSTTTDASNVDSNEVDLDVNTSTSIAVPVVASAVPVVASPVRVNVANVNMKTAYDQVSRGKSISNLDTASMSSQKRLFDNYIGKLHHSGSDIHCTLLVTLNDLYLGCTLPVTIQRKIAQQSRSSSNKSFTDVDDIITPLLPCPYCQGLGRTIQTQYSNCGYEQDITYTCPACQGQGCVFSTQVETVTLSVQIDPGMQDGEVVTFMHQGHVETLNSLPGHVYVTVKQEPHKFFIRRRDDLLFKQEITLKEALTGFDFVIPHLNGHNILVKPQPGQIVVPSVRRGNKRQPYCQRLMHKGMPRSNNPTKYGDLYVAFDIDFPTSEQLSDKAIEALRQHLPGPQRVYIHNNQDDSVEIAQLKAADIEHFGTSHGSAMARCENKATSACLTDG